MGLDATHNCWHGAYTEFMRWRSKLLEVAHGRSIMRMQHYGGTVPWSILGKDPLVILLDHSDCDGEIEAKDCGPLAARLEELLPALREAGDGGGHSRRSYETKTKQFIEGLRLAASRNENVKFY